MKNVILIGFLTWCCLASSEVDDLNRKLAAEHSASLEQRTIEREDERRRLANYDSRRLRPEEPDGEKEAELLQWQHYQAEQLRASRRNGFLERYDGHHKQQISLSLDELVRSRRLSASQSSVSVSTLLDVLAACVLLAVPLYLYMRL